MKITDEQKTKGIEIATGLKITVLYINDKGEFFTSENLAQLSVAGDKKKYQKLDFALAVEEDFEVTVEMIHSLDTVEEVQTILDAELVGLGDAEIIAACEARIEELTN